MSAFLGTLVLSAAFLLGGPTQELPPVGDPQEAPDREMVEVEVASVGVDLATSAPLALLHSDWVDVLPIWIGEHEATAIARALQNATMPRPMTHDLLVGVIRTLGGTLEEVRVTELREATFYGVLRIRTAAGVREVDTRPSDALALAVRTGARILVATQLLRELPEVEFLSADEGNPVVRVSGITVGGDEDHEGVRVLHTVSEVEARDLRRGDQVISVGERSVAEPFDFLQAMRALQGEGAVQITRIRDGESRTIQLPPRRGPARSGE